MPAAANTWLTFNVGPMTGSANREDLLDVITNLDMEMETPFFTSAPKTTARHTLHEWLTDALAATATAGAIEGDDFTPAALTNRTRQQNLCQIFRKDFAVSDTQRSVNPAGVSDEYSYQLEKALKEIARNVESTVFKVDTASATGASGTARTMKGLRGFAPAGLTSAVNAAISTGAVVDIHELMYVAGANPETMYVSPGVKRDFTVAVIAATSQNLRNIAAADRKHIANIDIFESDFGMLAVVPDRFVPQSTGSNGSACFYLVERAKCRLAFLRPLRHVPIAKIGDAMRGLVVTELTLEALTPSAIGVGSGVIT